MHTETKTGLLSCKPGNEPTEGEVKTFVIEQRLSKKGKPWLKIKSAGPDYGGQPYRIVSAEQTDFVDAHGNLSFNVELEAVQNGQEPQKRPVNAPESSVQRFNGLDERQRAIIRQHSQSSALQVLTLKQLLGELSVEDLTPAKIKQLATFFDADVYEAIAE